MTLDWFKFTQIADKFQYKAKFEDREDLRQDIILKLAEIAGNNGHEPFNEGSMIRIASYTVLSYWRDIKRKPSMLKLSSEIEDDDGTTREGGGEKRTEGEDSAMGGQRGRVNFGIEEYLRAVAASSSSSSSSAEDAGSGSPSAPSFRTPPSAPSRVRDDRFCRFSEFAIGWVYMAREGFAVPLRIGEGRDLREAISMVSDVASSMGRDDLSAELAAIRDSSVAEFVPRLRELRGALVPAKFVGRTRETEDTVAVDSQTVKRGEDLACSMFADAVSELKRGFHARLVDVLDGTAAEREMSERASRAPSSSSIAPLSPMEADVGVAGDDDGKEERETVASSPSAVVVSARGSPSSSSAIADAISDVVGSFRASLDFISPVSKCISKK